MSGRHFTVGELIKELQRAIIVEELTEHSEVLNWELAPAKVTLVAGDYDNLAIVPGHVVVE